MTAAALSDPHLEELRRAARETAARVEGLTDGLSQEQLDWSPRPGAWSIAQCLEHLIEAVDRYEPNLEGAFPKARERGSRGAPYRASLMGRLMCKFVSPDSKPRLKAPRMFQPLPKPDPGANTRFLDRQERLIRMIETADGADLTRVKLASPVTRFIRFNIGDAFALLVRHAERHVQQMARVREDPAFPAG